MHIIVDETDVENLEFMILNRLNYMGISAKFIDDLNTDIINGEMLCISDGEGKLFMLLPDIDIEEFEKEYRERIVLNDLAQAFSSLDDNEALLRNSRELKRLKRREKLLTEFCSNEEIKPVKEERPKQYHKISEK